MSAGDEWTGPFLDLVEDCEKRESRLDDWSRTFIDSIRKQLEQAKPLTAKQAVKLDEIWERATARG